MSSQNPMAKIRHILYRGIFICNAILFICNKEGKETKNPPIVLPSHYHPTPRQRLFFERFAFGYSRSVVWLEPHGCLAGAARLFGYRRTVERMPLYPSKDVRYTPTTVIGFPYEGTSNCDRRHQNKGDTPHRRISHKF